MKKLQLPFGVQDYLPEECYNKKRLEDKLSQVFSSYGFDRIETASLEYYDLFNNVVAGDKINKMFKMTDNDGSLLVLRPDTTIQVCRMAASKLDIRQINKLYYIENSFEYLTDSSSARSREFAQAGVEMLGNTGQSGNVEILRLAIEALLHCGLTDFLIEIGQIRFFEGLMQEAGLQACEAKQLRALINSKDMLGVEMFLQKKKVRGDIISKFLLLPTLFGDVEVLEKAKAICNNETGLKAIEDLQYIMNALHAMQLDSYVSIDLGMLQGDYYTGMIVHGVSRNLGVSLLDGGRYDKLGDAFHAPVQAVGFAIGLKRLLVALDNQNALQPMPACDVAYISDEKDFAYERTVTETLRKSGVRLTKCFDMNQTQLVQYCKKNTIKKAFAILGKTQKQINIEE